LTRFSLSLSREKGRDGERISENAIPTLQYVADTSKNVSRILISLSVFPPARYLPQINDNDQRKKEREREREREKTSTRSSFGYFGHFFSNEKMRRI
jgi:hypothetical protein